MQKNHKLCSFTCPLTHTHTTSQAHTHTHTVQRHRIDRLPPFVTRDRAHTNFMAPQSDSKVAPALHSPHRGAPALWARCATRTAQQQERKERGEERRGEATRSQAGQWACHCCWCVADARADLLACSQSRTFHAEQRESAGQPAGQSDKSNGIRAVQWDGEGGGN